MWVGRLRLLSVFWSSWIGPELWFWTSQPRGSHINDPEGLRGSAGKRWVSERIRINHSAGLFASSVASWECRGGVWWGVTLGVDVLKLIKHTNGLSFFFFLTSFSATALWLVAPMKMKQKNRISRSHLHAITAKANTDSVNKQLNLFTEKHLQNHSCYKWSVQ